MAVQGLKAIRESDGGTEADEGVQRLIRRRIGGYPDEAKASMHHARSVADKYLHCRFELFEVRVEVIAALTIHGVDQHPPGNFNRKILPSSSSLQVFPSPSCSPGNPGHARASGPGCARFLLRGSCR